MDQVTGIVERADVRAALINSENEFAKLGWDQPPALASMFHYPDGDLFAVDIDGFEEAMRCTGNPVDAIDLVAAAWETPRAEPIDPACKIPDLLGVMLLTETWMVPYDPSGPRPTGDFSTHPDRIERRNILMMGVDGSLAVLTRRRGADPVWEDTDRLQGRMIAVLSRVTMAIKTILDR